MCWVGAECVGWELSVLGGQLGLDKLDEPMNLLANAASKYLSSYMPRRCILVELNKDPEVRPRLSASTSVSLALPLLLPLSLWLWLCWPLTVCWTAD